LIGQENAVTQQLESNTRNIRISETASSEYEPRGRNADVHFHEKSFNAMEW